MQIFNQSENSLKIEINDEIGFWGVNQQDIKDKLKNFSGSLDLEIASLGGDVFHALAIFNLFKSHKGDVTANIFGHAASASTFIAQSASHIRMAENVFFLIHNANGGASGEAEDLRVAAESMEKHNESIKKIYMDRTGLSHEKITDLMNKGEWMSAKEALDLGFVDEIVPAHEILNKSEVVIFNCLNSEKLSSSLLNKINSIEMDKKNMEEVSNGIFNRVMDKVKEILPKNEKALDEDSESKVVELCNEVAEEIKNEATEAEEGFKNKIVELETEKAQLEEVKNSLEKELNTLKADKVDPAPAKDPDLQGGKKEATPLDNMVEKMKMNLNKYTK